MITPTGEEQQVYQLPEVPTTNFEEIWFQAENPFAQFSMEEKLIGKKRKLNQLKENQKKYQKIEEENSNLKEQLQNNQEYTRKIQSDYNLILHKLDEAESENHQFRRNNQIHIDLTLQENTELRNNNSELLEENEQLRNELEKTTNEKMKISCLLTLVSDQLEEVEESRDNLVQFLAENRDSRYKNEFQLKKGTPVIDLDDF